MTRFRFFSVLILLAAFGLRLHLAPVLGTQNDEGVHLTAAERISSGERLYRDLFENRTPGVEWSLGAVFRVAGPDQFLARYLNIGLALLTIAGLVTAGRATYRLLTPKGGDRVPWAEVSGWLAALLFALAPMPLFWSRYVMLEHWQTAAATLSVACAILAWPAKRRWWLLSGILAGVAVLGKQTAIITVVALALYLAFLMVTADRAQMLGNTWFWLVGLAVVVFLVAMVLAVQGSLESFMHYVSGAERLDPLSDLLTKGESWLSWAIRSPVVWMAAAGLAAIIFGRQPALAILPIWAGLETAALFGPARLDVDWGGFSHYLLPSVAALSLLAGLGYSWLWQHFWPARGWRWIPVAFSVLLLLTLPAWLLDLNFAARRTQYPQPDQSAEDAIAAAAATMTGEDQPILALANGVFYFRSGRPPENVFFHYPEYLSASPLGPESEADIVSTLADPALGAALISRMHLEERLSPAMMAALWQHWTPAAVFSYPYQRDVFLFLPSFEEAPADDDPVAAFRPAIKLLDVRLEHLDSDSMLVGLTWTTEERLDEDLVVFVHLLAEDGSLVAQHDGVPVVGFRPTTSWQVGERLVDQHWVNLPEEIDLDNTSLSIGLYDPVTGERSSLLSADGLLDSSFLMEFESER